MKFRYKPRPHFLKRELGFLIGLISVVTFLLVPVDYATSSVIKMPKPLPNIVKNYKSMLSPPLSTYMQNSYLRLNKGDFVTVLAAGQITTWQERYEPKTILLYQLGEKDSVRKYNGPELIEVPETGWFYLGYKVNMFSGGNNPGTQSRPSGGSYSFDVDIIVWKTKDPVLVTKFLEEASLTQSGDHELKEMVEEFKKRYEASLAAQKKPEGAGEVKKEEIKVAEAKPAIAPQVKEEVPGTKKPEREKQVPEQKVAKKVEQKPSRL